MTQPPGGRDAAPQPAQPGPVRRMTFAYDGDRIELIAEHHVQLIVPPTEPLDQAGAVSGLTVVLRDQKDQPVYRATPASAIPQDVEVFNPPGSRDSITRVPVDQPKGAFFVLVPDVPGAKTLEFVGPALRPDALSPDPLHGGAVRAQPRSLARFELKPFEGN